MWCHLAVHRFAEVRRNTVPGDSRKAFGAVGMAAAASALPGENQALAGGCHEARHDSLSGCDDRYCTGGLCSGILEA